MKLLSQCKQRNKTPLTKKYEGTLRKLEVKGLKKVTSQLCMFLSHNPQIIKFLDSYQGYFLIFKIMNGYSD